MKKLISIDLEADFGFLRKPDTNEGISMTYNMLHKPALLGIFGAILGLKGYQRLGELPEYYKELHSLKIGVEPLRAENGNFSKTTVVYTNTIGYANKDKNNAPFTFVAYENTLIKPSYRIFIALSNNHPLYDSLKNGHAEFIPYLGKNEFPVWWQRESFKEYELKPFDYRGEYQVRTMFCKGDGERSRSYIADADTDGFSLLSDLSVMNESFFYFERLPLGFQEFDTKRGKEYQYLLSSFVFSNAKFSESYKLENLYSIGDNEVVQLN